jgi:hypothetical protein
MNRLALIAATALLACAAGCSPQTPAPKAPDVVADAPIMPAGLSAAPPMVRTSHGALLAAAKARDLKAIAAILQADNAKFDFGASKDPVAYWETLKADGVDVAADLERILMLKPGAVLEGDKQLFAWPYLYGMKPAEITGQAMEDVKALGPKGWDPATDASFKETGYLGWRVLINADGTVEAFVRGD